MTTKQVNIDFITTENIEMIWEIIIDDIKDVLKTQHQISKTRNYFINQARVFFERENSEQQDLMQLNKKFISQIMQSFDNYNAQTQTQNQTHFQSQNSPPSQQNKPIFRAEDIQAERRSAFEKGLAEKRNDFISAMNVPVPETPNFSDNNLDKPIGGAMEELIARTLAQRNFEIETFSKPVNKESVENWLKPTETSVKSEKIIQKAQGDIQMEEKQKQYQYTHQSSPKFINIGEELPIIPRNKKQISWGKNQEYEINEINLEVTELTHNQIETGPTLFSKLKYIKEEPEKPEPRALPELNVITKVEPDIINDRLTSLENKLSEILHFLKNSNNNNKIELESNNNIDTNYTEES